MDINQAKLLFKEICEQNKSKDKILFLGIEGEKQHGYEALAWVEKLEPHASDELKIAALFHDIDRIVNEGVGGGSKHKRSSPEYRKHKKEHASRSAEYLYQTLISRGVEKQFASRVKFLISHHDDQQAEVVELHDPELDILVTADSLTFINSNAEMILERLGPVELEGKLSFMISKVPTKLRKILLETKLNNELIENQKNQIIKGLAA